MGGNRNPGVAAVLSAFVPGLGQIYNGHIGEGVLWMSSGAILAGLVLGLTTDVWRSPGTASVIRPEDTSGLMMVFSLVGFTRLESSMALHDPLCELICAIHQALSLSPSRVQ